MGKLFQKHWDLVILFSLVALYIVTFSWLSILRHDAFASSYDLANMGQTVWNTLNGRFFSLSIAEGTVSRFSIHTDLILVLLAPLYLLWDNVRILLVTQSIFLGSGGIPLYFLSKKVLGNLRLNSRMIPKIVSLVLVAVYLLNPSMEWVNIYDFHGVALSIPLILAAFYFAYSAAQKTDPAAPSQRNKLWIWFWIFIALALTTKEEVGLLVSMTGLAIFFAFKQRRMGALTFAAGLGWFLLAVFVVIPKFSENGQAWGFHSLYAIALKRISDSRSIPQFLDVFRGYFLNSVAFSYYTSLLRPFSFIPLLGLPWLILAVPEFVINLLSTDPAMQATTYHYQSGIIPFLNVAVIFGLYYLFSFLKFAKTPMKYLEVFILVLSAGMLIAAARVNYHYSPLPTTPSCWCAVYRVSSDDIAFDNILKTIPESASVASSSEVRAHLTRRRVSLNLPSGAYDADYVAMIDQDRAVGDYNPKIFENKLMKDPRFLSSHTLISHIGHFYLYGKN